MEFPVVGEGDDILSFLIIDATCVSSQSRLSGASDHYFGSFRVTFYPGLGCFLLELCADGVVFNYTLVVVQYYTVGLGSLRLGLLHRSPRFAIVVISPGPLGRVTLFTF